MKKKLYLNNVSSILNQLISIIVGLILPRLFLSAYGSDVNGLVSSITQMLSVISILDFGVGAVVQSALYKPLSEKDYNTISNIYSAAQKYFKLIAQLLLIYIFLLCIYFGFVKNTGYNPIYSMTLIISISISSFAQYYFGICNSLLLNADQKIYITCIVNIFTLIINAILMCVLINMKASVQVVKLISSLIFIFRPVVYSIYIKRHYKIKNVKNPPKKALRQKWHGLAQHITSVVTDSTDYVVLTIFSTFQTISIYNIYVMPLNSIKGLMIGFSSSYKSYFGMLFATNKIVELKNEFRAYELLIHFLSIVIFTSVSKVIVSFVLLYTKGVNDVNYENYLFAYVITLAYAIIALKIPYTTIIFSAGHFRQTQFYCVMEALINVSVSVVFVIKFGLIGVALGTCLGVGYRLFASVYYLKKEIINRKLSIFIKTLIVDLMATIIVFFVTSFFKFSAINVLNWTLYSIMIFMISLIITTIIYTIFYPDFIKRYIGKS